MSNQINLYWILICLLTFVILSIVIIGNPSIIESLKEKYFNEDGNLITYVDNNRSHQAHLPTERSIILRIDDVQGYLWRDLVINLTDTILNRNMSVTLAVIPGRSLDKDDIVRKYLIEKSKDPRIEIAQHGFKHTENEFLNLNRSETYDKIMSGLDILKDVLRVMPVTFIPPYNDYNNNTISVLSEINYSIISARRGEYTIKDRILEAGFNTETKGKISHNIQKGDHRYDNEWMKKGGKEKDELIPVSIILDICNRSLQERNICVIMIHPQDYANEDRKTMNNTKYAEFIHLLDGLKSLNARSIMFKDLIIYT